MRVVLVLFVALLYGTSVALFRSIQDYTFLENNIKYSKAITIDEWVYRCNKVLSNVGSEPLRKEK